VEVRHTDIEHKLLESLVEIQQAVKLLGFDRVLIDNIDKCKKLINDKQYNVAVMGGFNCGKSSIINALLGTKVLPTDAIPTTATVNRIKYGEEKVIIKFQDGSEKEIGINELEDYVTKLTSDKKEQAAKVEEAVVYYPTRFCSNNIDIIDTPGLNDSKDMTDITRGMLDSVDAVIMPIHTKAQFGKWETEFVCDLITTSEINNVLFVVNFMDLLDKDDYDDYEGFLEIIKNRIQTGVINKLEESKSGEDVIARAHRLLDNMKVCGISAKLALSKEPQKKKESRFDEFEKLLEKSITFKQIDNVSNKTINSIKHIISEFESQDKKRRDYYDRKAVEIQSGESMVGKYAGDADKFLNGVFAEDYEMLASVMQEVNEFKQLIKERFIKALSTVRENTDASIRAALENASYNVCNALRQIESNKRIYEVFKASARRLINYRKEKLGGIFERLGISGGYFYLSTESLTDYAETVLMKNKKTKFDWSVSPVPAGNLAKINVIEAVTRAANASVDNYKRELDSAAAAIRANWFRQFDEDMKTAQSEVIKVIDVQRKELDDQKTAYVHNYRVFSESSKAILSECESIRAESY